MFTHIIFATLIYLYIYKYMKLIQDNIVLYMFKQYCCFTEKDNKLKLIICILYNICTLNLINL